MYIEKILQKLVSFKTISETSNKQLVDFISDFLKTYGINAKKIQGDKNQYNLYCRIGPKVDGGVVFSGHTDVVPTDGQKWKTDPFKLTKKKNRLYGRGTSDMKGFIAVVLSLIKKIKITELKKPIHLIFSYDEEIGCIGIQKLVPFLKKLKPKPIFCIVGEPTEMKLVNQHKGKKNYLVSFNGIESHSSLIDDGVNSIKYCSKFIDFLEKKQVMLRKRKNNNFHPNFSTINIGRISGGIAVNIIPKKCDLEFEIRDTPNFKTEELITEITIFLKNLEKAMKRKNKNCFIKFKKNNDFPPLKTDEDSEVITFCLRSLNSNSINSVSFGTEAGVFNKLDFQTIVCGPGSIKQAHKPDEFIELNQIKKCENFLEKVINQLY
ncbi:MAG: acetylornithine deacetylase [Pseudomonadota bacterium]|nr:acetylornithine deacetylase [Pseudomonadota bacterium]